MQAPHRPLVALIVDNPLRDLDGLVLLAATLAARGVDAALVPMYDQGFDIPALAPDVVVANYVRDNNRDLLARYRQLGTRIVVLDSEGAAGRTAADFARLVARMQPGALVDEYCVWGRSRYEALLSAQALPSERVHLTGCPRYDFCAEPWLGALAPAALDSSFVLVNTNFPLPNPRFAASADEERRTLQRVWADEGYVAALEREARTAFEGMLRAIESLARRFRNVPVVVRPHPFESTVPYENLAHAGNLQVRQEGTSLQWIRAASLLVHQNCSTAVEAVMLAREPLSLEWLSSEALRLPGPSSVSVAVGCQAELEEKTGALLAGQPVRVPPEVAAARRGIIEDLFFANDGKASERVANVILESLSRAPAIRARARRRPRAIAVEVARRFAGYRNLERLRGRAARHATRRAAKAFALTSVQEILERIARAAGGAVHARASAMAPERIAKPRTYSGHSLQIVKAA